MHWLLLGAAATAHPLPAAPTAYPLECSYVAKRGELDRQGPCARMEGDAPRIDPAHLARMAFDHGLAEVRIDTAGIAYVRRDGRAALVFIFDNGADYFKQGLARGLRHGKLVYYDRRLRPVIVTGYDWGEPFEHGRAGVCIGCKVEKLGDEHSYMAGGRWGVIDRRGKLVVPLAP